MSSCSCYHQAAVGEQAFGEDYQLMDLMDQFADGGGQWQWSLHDVSLDGVWCFVGCKVEA